MTHLAPLLLCIGLVATFYGVVYKALRTWGQLSRGQRRLCIGLLIPHALLLLCITAALAGRAASMGEQLVLGVFMIFILPIPALFGTTAVFVILSRAGAAFTASQQYRAPLPTTPVAQSESSRVDQNAKK